MQAGEPFGEIESVKAVSDLYSPVTGEIVDVNGSIKDNLEVRNPSSLRICALLDKRERREKEVKVDYVGFEIPDAFVVGYGLDYAQKYRNLPYIAVLEPA